MRNTKSRGGLTLLELLIALSIMVIVVGTLAGLSKAVQLGSQYSDGHGTAAQHGRVSLERICRTVNEATANEQFPGFLVVAEDVSGRRFPDTLVVWHPDGSPADAKGLPRYNELVIYCPNPDSPNQLLEITLPSDARQVSPVSDRAAWAAELKAIKKSPAGQKVSLTDLVRTALVTASSPAMLRGAVRFESRLRPTEAEWAGYRSGSPAWEDLPWVQGIYGSKTGLRQAWLRIELQLVPAGTSAGRDAAGQQAIPLFGSAAVYYQLRR